MQYSSTSLIRMSISCLLRRFQLYFRAFTPTDYLFLCSLGFSSTRLWHLKVLPSDTPNEKVSAYIEGRAQGP